MKYQARTRMVAVLVIVCGFADAIAEDIIVPEGSSKADIQALILAAAEGDTIIFRNGQPPSLLELRHFQ